MTRSRLLFHSVLLVIALARKVYAQHLPAARTNGSYASARWNHGRRSSGKYCLLLGCSRAA